MTPEQINEYLDCCGPIWLGGQRAKIVEAMTVCVAAATANAQADAQMANDAYIALREIFKIKDAA